MSLNTNGGKYKFLQNRDGYEHILTKGKIYCGIEEAGIFSNRPYLVVYDEGANEIAVAHLSRFERQE